MLQLLKPFNLMFRNLRNLLKDLPLLRKAVVSTREMFTSPFLPRLTSWGFMFLGPIQMQTEKFEVEETNIIRKLLSITDLFINVGANAGYYCCHALTLKVRTIAIEPLPANLSLLIKNVNLNNSSDLISILPTAVGNTSGLTTLWGRGTAASLIRGWAGNKYDKTIVPINRLNDIINPLNLSGKQLLILIDVEGAEWSVIQEAGCLLSLDPPPLWFVEIANSDHRPIEYEHNSDFLSIYNHFSRQGYTCIQANSDLTVINPTDLVFFNQPSERSSIHNFLFVHTNSLNIFQNILCS